MTVKSFSRRISRTLRKGQQELISSMLPLFMVDKNTDFLKFKSEYKEVILEIGFGNGEFIFNKALRHEGMYIGADPYLNGVASLLAKIIEHDIKNIRIFADDINLLLEYLPQKYFKKVYIICPDPWPKRRHNKRRLISRDFLEKLKLYCKGYIEIVTDHIEYANWIKEEIDKAGFKYQMKELPPNWIYTKYQRRGLQNTGAICRFII